MKNQNQATKEMVIDVNQDGSVESLYNDKVQLGHLGTVSMKRASHIVFDDLNQLWDVVPVGYESDDMPDEYHGYVNYVDAITYEVAVLNEARKYSMLDKLTTPQGFDLASIVHIRLVHDGAFE